MNRRADGAEGGGGGARVGRRALCLPGDAMKKEKKKVNRPKRERGAFLKTFSIFCVVLLPRVFFTVSSSRNRRRHTTRPHRDRSVRRKLSTRRYGERTRGAADNELAAFQKSDPGDRTGSVFSAPVNR